MQLTIDFDEYKPWSGAISTYDRIEEEGKLDELEFLLDELYSEGMTTTQLNDLLWFDSEWIFEQLNINDNEEIACLRELLEDY